jgi:hypothetical protein
MGCDMDLCRRRLGHKRLKFEISKGLGGCGNGREAFCL